jgi:ribosomal protein L37E
MAQDCPACGYKHSKNEHDESCPSCGFGPHVDESAAEWAQRWKDRGMPWSSMMVPQPRAWDPTSESPDDKEK